MNVFVRCVMIGSQIGRYRITAELGRGGMGVVYRATQVTLNRTVAVKMLFPHLAESPEHLARFRREAETLARLDHESIVRIFDIEEYRDTHCIIMEFVPGPSLASVLARERRLTPERARTITAELASALCAAHRQHIIHRDIKPDNVLFTLEGRPKLTDFGIARMADGSSNTRTGILIGTPSYMSPEQARGQPVTAASDLYSLGVLLFEMLSGQVPFQGDDPVAVALMHLTGTPPALQSLLPAAPADLCALVQRLLHKDPTARGGSAAQLRDALLRLRLTPAARRPEESLLPDPAQAAVCPECNETIQPDFLTCPHCGLSVRQHCQRCSRLFDPLSPECPYCRTPATPLPAARTSVAAAAGLPAVMVARLPAVIAARLPGRGAGAWSLHPRPAFLASMLLLVVAATLVAGYLARGDGRVGLGEAPGVSGDGGFVGVQSRRGRDPGAAFAPPAMPLSDAAVDAISRAAGHGPPDSAAVAADETEDAATEETAGADAARGAAPAPGGAPGGAPATAPAGRRTAEPGSNGVAAAAIAREMILVIIERQQRATEQGDLELLLADVAPHLHDAVRASFADMQGSASDVQSRIGQVTIELQRADVAAVAFHTRLTGRRIRDKRQVVIFDGTVRWTVQRRQDRWLITDM
jgi:hypothetical protein